MNKLQAYFRDSYEELVEKVSWPTWAQLQHLASLGPCLVVIALMVVLMMMMMMMVDCEAYDDTYPKRDDGYDGDEYDGLRQPLLAPLGSLGQARRA